MYSDCNPDYIKMTLLNLPAALLVRNMISVSVAYGQVDKHVDSCFWSQTLGALFSVDDLTGFEITKALELPQPYGIIAVWGIALPAIFVLSNSLTNLVLKDGLILKVISAYTGTCIVTLAAFTVFLMIPEFS